MRRVLRENGLTLFFIALFLVMVFLQALAGHLAFNADQKEHGQAAYTLSRYMISSDFAEQLSENWQSEFLQFGTFIIAAIWLRQKGSTESKDLESGNLETDEEQQVGRYATEQSPRSAARPGWRLSLYSISLSILMFFLFFASWAGQSVSGWTEYNSTQKEHHQSEVSWLGYTQTSDFWTKSLQNWQSEFLAVASISIFSVFLRQRGSPQSKPVGAPHDATSVES